MTRDRDDVQTTLPPEMPRFLEGKGRGVAQPTSKRRRQTTRTYFFRGMLQR